MSTKNADIEKRTYEALGALREGLEAEGGQLVLSYSDEWTAAIVFGQEAEDSDMAGGAAYGAGETLSEALRDALGQTGWLEQ